MALRDWQLALGQRVEARSSGRDMEPVLDSLASLDLKDEERAWLQQVTGTPGFALTGYVPRWWRETRVRRTARLTLAALGGDAGDVLRDYLRAVPCFTLFFVAEGLRFLEHVAATTQHSRVRAVARFEHALWMLGQVESPPVAPASGLSPDTRLVRHPAAALVTFDAPWEAVLGALLTGAPPPAGTGESHPVLVAPGVPRRWRPASADEARAFAACEATETVAALSALPGVSEETVLGLLDARALQFQTCPTPRDFHPLPVMGK